MKRPGWLTWALLALIIVFAAGDAFAEYKGDGTTGSPGETVSTFLHHLEKGRWYVRAIIGVFCVLMASHLTFGTDLIPGVV